MGTFNVFVVSGSIPVYFLYKLLKELYKVDSIGPIMLGMDKPVHIFQLGASVEEMVNMVAVAVVDAQEKQKRATHLVEN